MTHPTTDFLKKLMYALIGVIALTLSYMVYSRYFMSDMEFLLSFSRREVPQTAQCQIISPEKS